MALFIVQMLSGKTVQCGSGINLRFALPCKKYGERRKFLVLNIVAGQGGSCVARGRSLILVIFMNVNWTYWNQDWRAFRK